MLRTCHNKRLLRRACCGTRQRHNYDSCGSLSDRFEDSDAINANANGDEDFLSEAKAKDAGLRDSNRADREWISCDSIRRWFRLDWGEDCEQEKRDTYGLVFACGLRGAGTSQRMRGPNLWARQATRI